ncbi:MAG: hypothetical protein Q4D38_14860 [Planctomycetia bacterium]|nr:hypothetical protein [Planctomycetia bacterium]
MVDGETFRIEMVHFDEPSRFGINEGRISKLGIRNTSCQTVAHYDRGWDLRPQTTATKALLRAILDKFN